MLHGCITHAKNPGYSEDADPFFSPSSYGSCVLAVFDGLGGAGARRIDGFDGSRTGAYYASRVVRQAIEDFTVVNPANFTDWGAGLRLYVAQGLKNFATQYPIPDSQIKGSLIRNLPTTLALCRLWRQPDCNLCEVFWAGDSRSYMLSAEHGLIQLSRDDIKGNIDPLQNLRSDAPLCNFINADIPYEIHTRLFRYKPEDLILCATDGCFGFYRSPMHFEAELLDCLTKSRSATEFNDRLGSTISKVTGDDATLVWFAEGFNRFEELASHFRKREVSFQCKVMRRLSLLKGLITSTEQHLHDLNQAYHEELHVSWSEYKTTYLSYWDMEC